MVENVGWKTTGFPGSKNKLLLGGGFKQILFSSVLGKIPILTYIFQMG